MIIVENAGEIRTSDLLFFSTKGKQTVDLSGIEPGETVKFTYDLGAPDENAAVLQQGGGDDKETYPVIGYITTETEIRIRIDHIGTEGELRFSVTAE